MSPPTKFTDAVKRRIIEAITLGCTYKISAAYSGIAESTLFKWLALGREGEDEDYIEFYRSVKEAEATSAVRNLAAIARAAREGHWTASAWLLERRHGYTKEAERPLIDITLEMQNTEVTTLIEEIQQASLQELLTGPVIDLDEE